MVPTLQPILNKRIRQTVGQTEFHFVKSYLWVKQLEPKLAKAD